MAAIQCPNCSFVMALQGAKPGRFYPVCQSCKEKFVLTIPDLGGEIRVEKFPWPEGAAPSKPPTARAKSDVVATMPPSKTPSASTNAAAGAAMVKAVLPSEKRPAASPARPREATSTSAAESVATMPPSRLPVAAAPATDGSTINTLPPSKLAPADAPPHSFTPAAGKLGTPAEAQSVVASPIPPAPDRPQLEVDLDERLGGYKITHKLGQGGMGSVYLARQLSLDRDVAIKVLAPVLADDPDFVARFTREAYAAAQLSHHNVVQIHDIGVEQNRGRETNFFSMEFVTGQTLGGLVQRAGKVDAGTAAGLMLQAARGLQFAHEHGLIHRDIKPDNLLLNDQGVVKVADLGLAKKLGAFDRTLGNGASAAASPAGQTQFSVSMGTPAYMPPEQFRDAASADARADVYSLGCTFYDLLTGHPPFAGKSSVELMTKHLSEAPVPPDRAAKNVPPALSSLVMRMIAKRPEDRFQSMAEVIAALENWLGVESGRPVAAGEQTVESLEQTVTEYNRNKYTQLRFNLLIAFVCLSVIVAGILALPGVGQLLIACGMIAFVLLTTLFYQSIVNVAQRTTLAGKVRQWLFGMKIADWLRLIFGIGVIALLSIAFRVHWVLVGFTGVALVTALVFYLSIDRTLQKFRRPLLDRVEATLRDMRLRGLDEDAVRQFIARHSGNQWEAIYEALFGYEDKLIARDKWGRGERARSRPKYAAWREPIITWLDRRIRYRRELRELRLLDKLEKKALAAKGIDIGTAAQTARKNAERMVAQAAKLRETAVTRSAATAIPTAAAKAATAGEARLLTSIVTPVATSKGGDADYESFHERHSYFSRRFRSPIDYLLGREARFILGVLIFAGFSLWWNQNSGAEMRRQATELLATREDASVTASKSISSALHVVRSFDQKPVGAENLQIAVVPSAITHTVGNWSGGLAGLVLMISVLCAGRILGISVLLSAAVILFGDRLQLPLLYGHPSAAMLLGLVMAGVGMFFLRDTRSE